MITNGGLRPLEVRRVNAISLKVARGPLRAISRLDSARSDIFFSLIRRTSAEAAIARERISPSRPLSHYLTFPVFSPHTAIYGIEHSHPALLSLGEIELAISPLGINSAASLWISSEGRKGEGNFSNAEKVAAKDDDKARRWRRC